MPISQEEHFSYTVNEWTSQQFKTLLSNIFNNNNIKNFIDIGANVGGVIKALDNLDYLKNIEKIILFEPDNENYQFCYGLINNLKTKYPNINFDIIKEGIYYGKTEAEVYHCGDNNIGGYFIDDDINHKNKLCSHLPRLSCNKIFKLCELEYYVNFDIDCIKIDIEGSELNLIENSQILKKSKFIILEWHYKTDVIEYMKEKLPNFNCILKLDKETNYLFKNSNS